MKNELVTTEPKPLAVREPSVGELMQGVIQAGITPASVEVMERLCALQERREAKEAERAFAAAFVAMQRDLPTITASTPVPGKDGSTRFVYAKLEDILPVARPVMLKHGFTHSFSSSTSEQGNRVTVTCTIRHEAGHSEHTPYTGRIGGGPPHASEAQTDGAGHSYAKRQAFLSALGIVPESDTDGADARNIGGPITTEEAAELRRRVKATKSNEAKFLAWAGVKSFEEIPTTKLAEGRGILDRREAKQREEAEGNEPDADWDKK